MDLIVPLLIMFSSPEEKARRAAFDAAYKQTGVEKVVTAYTERIVPKNIKEIGEYALPLVNSVATKSFTISFVF